MRNKTMVVALLVAAAVVMTGSYAYACGDGSCPVHGFFNSLGGFLYNALPWNWGNWAGK
jgi:hypothetical protein